MIDLTAIDLFCGAGGLSEGLTQAGFNIVFASDINQKYISTYKQNHPDTLVFGEDIRSLSNSLLESLVKMKPGQLDLLAGGPPCQGFSINAPLRSENDHRNHLFWEFIRIAEFLCPKFILIENVPGIVSYENGKVVNDIVTTLKKIGYKVNYKILLAAHYGVPQTRWRTFFLGTRLSQCNCLFPEPTHYANTPANFSRSKELCFTIPENGTLFFNLLPCTTVW
jgi:DNA (cytosine-5)-methyltransferase 1